MGYYRNNLQFSKQSGQTLVELVVVLAIVGMIVTGIVSITAISVRNARFTKDQASASRYTQEAMEWIRQQRDTNWSTFSARSGRTYCMNFLYWDITNPCTGSQVVPNTTYIRTATLITLDASSIQVEVEVSWTDARGSHQSRMSTILTSWMTQ